MIIHPPLTDLAITPLLLLAIEELILCFRPNDLVQYKERKTLKFFLGLASLIGAWIAYLSGIYHQPYKDFSQDDELFLKHQLFGKIFLIIITFTVLLNIILCTVRDLKPNAVYISLIYKLLVPIALIVVFYTALLGGTLVFG